MHVVHMLIYFIESCLIFHVLLLFFEHLESPYVRSIYWLTLKGEQRWAAATCWGNSTTDRGGLHSHAHAHTLAHTGFGLQPWRTVSSLSHLISVVVFFSHTEKGARKKGGSFSGFVSFFCLQPAFVLITPTCSARCSWWCSYLNTDFSSIYSPNR